METVVGKQQKPLKIIGVAGSPHKNGMTATLLLQALKGAETAGAITEVAFLADEEMEPCRGCGGNCWETCECAVNPLSSELNTRLQNADGLVMAVPVYCWQMNSLTHLFIDKMRWNTGSVLHPRNCRAAFGIACAGGSGTGCVLGLQALYRYFYNWAFHGIQPLPVNRFNYRQALKEAFVGGGKLVDVIRSGLQPFSGLGTAMADLDSLTYMTYGALDELRLIVRHLKSRLSESSEPMTNIFNTEAELAEDAWKNGDRQSAIDHLTRAYDAGRQAYNDLGSEF